MNQSTVLSYAGWLSVITLSWLMVTRQVPGDATTWGFWTFFLVFAILASARSVSLSIVETSNRRWRK